MPSLNLPATHAVHAAAHGTHAFSAALLQVGSELHDTHTEAPATERVALGHAGHALRPEKWACLPTEHGTHAVEPAAEANVGRTRCKSRCQLRSKTGQWGSVCMWWRTCSIPENKCTLRSVSGRP